MSEYKKQLGQALNEIKKSSWFLELDESMQKEALEQTKRCYTPPNDMENTLMNIKLGEINKYKEWCEYCSNKFPWADPQKTKGEVGIAKRNFLTAGI